MTQEEYERELKFLEEIISQGKAEKKYIEQLEALYNYKPVSMQWFLIKGMLLLQQKEYQEVINKYKDRINREYGWKENIAIWKLVIEAYKGIGQETEGKRQEYMLSKLTGGLVHKEIDEKIKNVKKNFIENDGTQETLEGLEELYYISNQKLMAFFVYLYNVKCHPKARNIEKESVYLNIDNIGYLYEYVKNKKTMIVVADGEETTDYDILVFLLHTLDIPVYMIGDMTEIEGEYSLEKSVQVSIENLQQYEDCVVIPAITKTEKGRAVGNNIPYIVDYLCKNVTEDDFAITLTSNDMIENLRSNEDFTKRFERLSCYEASYLENEIGFGRAGDYYTYISRLYDMDVKSLVELEPECDFSIVIPVRNVTETLFYTLKTCLEQEYDGTYEVILSDNSTNGNDTAYEIFKRFDDARLKYYKTPRDLYLSKSYEFAYLQTKGRFIIPIGADDGILPWALKTLKEILDNEKCANVDIISWIRGFYAWPGFNGGQEHQFTIPAYFVKNKVNASFGAANTYWRMLRDNPSCMYVLPNMYINSGFSRKYLKVLYQTTGCLLDGLAQDIYMGLTNLAMNASRINIEYPITIAGMSSSSVGNVCNKASGGENVKLNKEFLTLFSGKGMYSCIAGKNRMYTPLLGTDVAGMYRSMGRLMVKNILPKDLYTEEDLKKIYLNCYESIDILADKYTQYVLEGYELARSISSEFAAWYEKEILVRNKRFVYINKEQIEKMNATKRYTEGYTVGGGVILDASKYGVFNIYEAVQLFKNFLHF